MFIFTITILSLLATAAVWLLIDSSTFWSDVEKAKNGENTKKYFSEFNNHNKKGDY